MKTRIESLGVYLPETVMTSKNLLKKCSREPSWDLEKITGIRQRYVSLTESSYDLALTAASRAIDLSCYNADDLDLIICTSISRYDHTKQYTYEPSLSARLKGGLQASNARHFDVTNACAGMFTGINLANNMLKSGAIKTALIVSGEMITYTYESALKHVEDNFNGQFAALTLGDSGAALILDASPNEEYGFHYIKLATGAKWSDLCIAKPSEEDSGGMMNTDSGPLQHLGVVQAVPRYLEAMGQTGWTHDELDVFMPHQTSRRAITKFIDLAEEAIEQKFKTKFIFNIQNYGNTASTTHFVALHESILNGNVQPDQNMIFASVASGLQVGMSTYTMDDLPLRYREYMTKGAIA